MKACFSIATALIGGIPSAHAQPQTPVNYNGIPQQRPETEKVVIKAEKGNHYYLRIYDATRKEVLEKELDSTLDNGLSSCELKKGVYSYIVSDKDNKQIKKGFRWSTENLLSK